MRHADLGLLFFLIFFAFKSYAYNPSEGNVTASYGAFLYKTNFTGNDQLKSSPILGDLGFITDGDLTDKGSIEIGLFHMNKMYYRNLNNLYLVEKTEQIDIVMGYRRWLSHSTSIGLGFAASYSLGDPRIVHSDAGVDQLIDTSARDTVEYGLESSIQQELWAKGRESVFADFRYNYSISNKENEKGDHYALFVAYRLVIQDKNSPPPQEATAAPDKIIEPRQDINSGESE